MATELLLTSNIVIDAARALPKFILRKDTSTKRSVGLYVDVCLITSIRAPALQAPRAGAGAPYI